MSPVCVTLDAPDDFEGWREASRALLMAGVAPADVSWLVEGDQVPLFGGGSPPAPPPDAPPPRVPRDFPDLARLASRHHDPERFALLHSLLHRLQSERGLLDDAADPEVARAQAMARAVRRDAHKMHAFLRFREVRVEDGAFSAPHAALPQSRFVAWYEPEHHILRAEAGFFVRRFASLHWSILTPRISAHWYGEELRFGPGARRSDAPAEDAAEVLWRAYFASIFNPARLKPDAMRAEMPKKYWRNLPETQDIPRLMAEAPKRVAEMVARGATLSAGRRQRPLHLPAHLRGGMGVETDMPADLPTDPGDYAEAQAALRRDLLARNDLPPWVANATQPVMGEGPQHPLLMFIGEQPGDEEDIQGRPFVGPAGRLWNKALEEAGVPRDEAYVTNAVKHFKFTPTGKRRLHQSPDAGDITFYRPFLQREITLVQPRLIVTLGATALRAVSGRAMPVTKLRGSLLRDPEGRPFYPTVHPSYLLRLPNAEAKAREYDRFVEDLGQAAATARKLAA
ncbi:UdgX family uracil-DNA binding protein [Roseomonas xinghualingensis]|uniref:UdgX family uracil-DNA binding protein n=1 Tax=Roseomonas xinghualingensis TaxID=2986475 RepID=UPI0021F21D22|nr:UdgX family uracil-DNA binding protein [Roseomonas sp. SXEYE001]MCV4205873.1 UdgX family uracil-DNA binding protein [Roseomonas sp. SXEYE001]